jgi:hypothetical protein
MMGANSLSALTPVDESSQLLSVKRAKKLFFVNPINSLFYVCFQLPFFIFSINSTYAFLPSTKYCRLKTTYYSVISAETTAYPMKNKSVMKTLS